jgi:hypothetical protein
MLGGFAQWCSAPFLRTSVTDSRSLPPSRDHGFVRQGPPCNPAQRDSGASARGRARTGTDGARARSALVRKDTRQGPVARGGVSPARSGSRASMEGERPAPLRRLPSLELGAAGDRATSPVRGVWRRAPAHACGPYRGAPRSADRLAPRLARVARADVGSATSGGVDRGDTGELTSVRRRQGPAGPRCALPRSPAPAWEDDSGRPDHSLSMLAGCTLRAGMTPPRVAARPARQ